MSVSVTGAWSVEREGKPAVGVVGQSQQLDDCVSLNK